jgi:hypothetical protein
MRSEGSDPLCGPRRSNLLNPANVLNSPFRLEVRPFCFCRDCRICMQTGVVWRLVH